MLIYNVTVNIEEDVHDRWFTWMAEKHIPDVMNTGMFVDNKICRVLVDEESGITYSIQYTVRDMETLKLYNQMYAPALQADHKEKFEGKYVSFRTVLEIVHEHPKL